MVSLRADTFWEVHPTPAFCVKFKSKDTGDKTFINFCTCSEIPPPKETKTEAQLAEVLESADPGQFKVPISLSDLREEKDKLGVSCSVYDCVINSQFYEATVKGSEIFQTFLVLIALDAIESKSEAHVDRTNWTLLKNKKSFGELAVQRIRKKPMPIIEEIHVEPITELAADCSTIPIPKGMRGLPEPRLEVEKLVKCGKETIRATTQLHAVKSASEVQLDVGDNSLILLVPKKFFLNVSFPGQKINRQSVQAEFNDNSSELIIEFDCEPN